MKKLKSLWNSVFLSNLFYISGLGVTSLFILGFFIPGFYSIAKITLFILLLLSLADFVLLYYKDGLAGSRKVSDRLSNTDPNPVTLSFYNTFFYELRIQILEELPHQMHEIGLRPKMKLSPYQNHKLSYDLIPKERGEYYFGKTNAFAKSPIGLVKRRFILADEKLVKVYPSYIKLRAHDFLSLKNHSLKHGEKKLRKVGNSKEFEHIKEYNPGDDFRSINWKNSAKQQKLMVNQYVTEKSQNIYSVIDKGRVMKMPFHGVSLLDYSINSSLALSSVALHKYDKVGMLSFSNQISNYVPADSRRSQIQLLQNNLYNLKTDFKESDFNKLYSFVRHKITQRSLLLLYTNFESLDAMQRQLNYLKALNKLHLLLVIIFENTEITKIIAQKPEKDNDIYVQIAAEKLVYDKFLIVKELKKVGIQTILTKPQNLTTNTINKYLEIKETGVL